MTRMAQERDSILHVCAKVDSYDELAEIQIGTEEMPDGESPEAADNRIRFCSVEKPLQVKNLAEIVFCEVSVRRFTSKLAKFLRVTIGEDITEKRLEVCSVCASFHFSHKEPHQTLHFSDPSISICTSEVCLPHESCAQG